MFKLTRVYNLTGSTWETNIDWKSDLMEYNEVGFFKSFIINLFYDMLVKLQTETWNIWGNVCNF